jgi:pantetheine-phosphate adenylyltransferase
MGNRLALYPGRFDPVTIGHLDLLKRARNLFDEVIVCVAETGGQCLFSAAERVDLWEKSLGSSPGCQVVAFGGLLVEEMQRRGAVAAVRGIRSPADYQHEWGMAGINRTLLPGSEYVYLLARPELSFVSSSLVRDVASHGGDVSEFVTAEVAAALQRRFAKGAR